MRKLALIVTLALPAVAAAQTLPAATTAPDAAPPPPEADLVLTGEQDGETLYVEHGVRRAGWDSQAPTTGSGDTFMRLCTAPCEAFIPPGDYLFTVSRYRTGTQDADLLTLGAGRHVLRAHYESRQDLRVVSAVLQVALAAAAVAVFVIGAVTGVFASTGDLVGLIEAVLLGSGVALFPLTLLRDDVSVREVR